MNLDPKELVSTANTINKKTEILSHSYPQRTDQAHTRGRTVLRYSVPEKDINISCVDMSIPDIANIMNDATKDAENQFRLCLKNTIFTEPNLGIKNYITTKTDRTVSMKNVVSLVNMYAQGGQTTLPQTSRMSGRYTLHQLWWIYYLESNCKKCKALEQFANVRFMYKTGRVQKSAIGRVLFMLYIVGTRSERPLKSWCRHITSNCIVWVQKTDTGSLYRCNDASKLKII